MSSSSPTAILRALCDCSVVDGDHVSLSLCSYNKTDLIRELQTMCSSKSEPDISKIAQSKEDFVFSGSPNGQSPHRRTDHEANALPQMQQGTAATSLAAAAVPPHHEHPLRPLTATRTELNQAAAAKQGRPQPDTTTMKTTNNTRKSRSYTETCMKTTTIPSTR
nr:cortactin-binding protein 2-like [Oncorhynchus nerka]